MGWSGNETGTETVAGSGPETDGAGTADLYDSPVGAVLPAAVLRASLLGGVLAFFALVLLVIAPQRAVSLMGSAGLDVAVVSPFFFVPVTVFVGTVAVVVLLSVAHYRNRRYELHDGRVVEYKGTVGTTDELEYDELEDVHLTRSRLQRVLGVGTVRLNDTNHEDDRSTEEMRLRYVEKPEEVYERLRNEAGAGATTAPVKVVEPVAKSIIPVTLVLAFVVALFIAVPLGLGTWFVGSVVGLSAGEIAAVFVGLLGATVFGITYYVYSAYDTTRYEIYDDHVEIDKGNEYTSVAYEDVTEVENSGDRDDEIANVRLNGDDETLGSLEYVRNPEEVRSRIEGLVETDDGGW